MIGLGVLGAVGAIGRYRLLLISLLVSTLALGSCNRQEPALDASVVEVLAPDGVGSGFALNRNGDVVTAFHAIEGFAANPDRIVVIETGRRAGTQHPVKQVSWISRPLDLAVIQVARLGQPPATLQAEEPRKGEAVYAVGFPQLLSDPVAAPLDPTVLDGTVARVRTDSWDRLRNHGVAGAPTIRIVEHSATLYPGNSGGPLVNACGEVVGINTAGKFLFGDRGDADGATVAVRGASYATHVSVLTAELDRLNIPYQLAEAPCGGSASRPWSYAVAGAAVALAATVLLSRLRRRPKPGGASGSDWVLSGVARDGRAIHVSVRKKDLARANGTLTFGRDPRCCEIVINDPTVSAHHGRLRIKPQADPDPGSVLVEDLRSTNGTFVDGKRVSPGPDKAVPLPVGSTLVIGGCRMRLIQG